MSKNKKHTPPLQCRIRRTIVGVSPSAFFARCGLGLHRRTRQCEGCGANIAEQIDEGFKAGLEAGMEAAKEDPWFRIDEHYNVIILREQTPEEKRASMMFREIADRFKAFYGIDDETPPKEKKE